MHTNNNQAEPRQSAGSGGVGSKPAIHFSFGSAPKASALAKQKKCEFSSSYLSGAAKAPSKALFRVSHF